jgi:rhodanese-related sulfurtransferase
LPKGLDPQSLELPPPVAQSLLDRQAVRLVDCREPFEFEICRISGAVLIPMNETPARLQELESMADEAPIVVYCHHGVRSLNVVAWLRRNGLENCWSLAGGIDAWSLLADASVPRY